MKLTREQKRLFKKNNAILRKNYIGLIEYLEKELPKNIDIYNENDEVDVLINGSRFYGVDARIFTGQQLEMFLEAPGVIELSPPVATEERTPFHVEFYRRFEKDLAKYCPHTGSDSVRPDVMNLFVFGLGLGLHLIPLAAHTRCREIVIVEPEPIFIQLSMYFLDWAKLLKMMKGRVQFIFNRDAEAAFTSLRWHIYGRNPGVQQKIYYYRHYKTPYVDAIEGYFKDNADLFFDGLGFYDDEKNMFRNHLSNLFLDKWTMSGPIKMRRVESAVVVGAGPSLQKDMEWLRENQSRLMIFSGGSALQALLRNGIVPDFHVEIENIALNYDILAPLFDQYDLKNVVLVCSSTMDTRSSRLFRRRMWFMREGVMATSLHAHDIQTMVWQNPTVVNTALSSALALGFRDVLLLGADFGTKNPKVHHTPDTSYETLDQLKTATFDFPEKVNGNFGGAVYTNRHMLNGIEALRPLIRSYPGVRVSNGSDGAAVPTVTPMRSSRYHFAPIATGKMQIVDQLYASAPVVDWQERLGDDLFDDMIKDIEVYAETVADSFKIVARKNRDVMLLLSGFYRDLLGFEAKYARYNPLITGTLTSFSFLLIYWWRRVPESEVQQFDKILRRAIKRFIKDVKKDFVGLLKLIRQELPLVRPELFDDKGNLIVEAESGVKNAE